MLMCGVLLICNMSKAITVQERDSLLNLPLFKNQNLLQIELQTDLAALVNDIADKRKYHQCNLLIRNGDSDQVDSLTVKVKTRGNFRRRKQNCDFPPLRFKIPTKRATGTAFEGQSKIKYVSHCQSLIENYDQHSIEEYLIYRMYNLVSPYSYRVRLAKLTFTDTKSDQRIEKYGFFLESKDDVATRSGRKLLEYKNMKQYHMLRSNMVMLSLFQLMIGNGDWNVEKLHNVDILSVSEHSIPVVVPFDFDWSSIINHKYYTLDPRIPEDAKYKRRYKSYKWSAEEFDSAFSNFKELKPSFMELISTCDYLEELNKQKLITYLEEFYQLIGSRKDIRTVIQKNALEIPDGR